VVRATGIGDVIRAWRSLGASTDDERRAIARLLGFDLRDVSATGPALPPSPPARPPAPSFSSSSMTERSSTSSAETGDEIELVEFPGVRDDATPLPSTGLARPTLVVPRPLDPLFAAPWLRAIAGTLTARTAELGAVNVRRAIDLVVRRIPMGKIPRRRRLVSATEIVVWIDGTGTISWFRDDASQLIEKLDAVTRAPVRVVRSRGAPTIATVRAIDDDGDEDDGEIESSIRVSDGARVIGVSDLGRGSPWARADASRVRGWIEAARRLRAQGATLVVVAPVPPAQLPPALRRMAPCVYWDGKTRPASIHRLIKELG
jgi:hypothetical protein